MLVVVLVPDGFIGGCFGGRASCSNLLLAIGKSHQRLPCDQCFWLAG